MKIFFSYATVAAIIFSAIQTLEPQAQAADENKYLNPPPEYIEYFHFGFRESLADSFWLRWIQDNDYCQTYLAPMQKLENPILFPSAEDLTSVPRYKVCENSWSFKMLDAVTKLAPRFDMPYLAGASTLAILVEDFAGATEIYERGLKVFPKDWQLLYRASFHYQYNLKDTKRAAELLEQAADHGGPYWLRGLAARLYSHSGQLMLALATLEAYRKTIDPENEKGLELVDKRMKELRAKLEALK